MPRDIALPRARLTRRRPSLLALLTGFFAIARQRRKLAALDDHQLQDLGLTRSQALEEARRGFWDAPNHWRL
ncbi:DUF1127 domain-containing protein [Alloyangia pacifica]|uniref:Uncharacterized conserved protein YjiS, DUF1127 family n=1 Tax=Alloyangia pacifica TaxID=311180 RepID=A0A1I6W1H7_9RHOB|nr:DUF1127 domain-containing protein [Alloyangia pacifica]SDI37193.1 Uncharacterized conserved protein YjiS, DUF1127 family [Alloyangia pacifica]SFT19838.1 Uncharacterized conserved protein YjiS, DUF1127 family [Alloyangia pacifica]